MNRLNKLLRIRQTPFPKMPEPDIAICSECNWRGPCVDCPTEEEGTWETGYFDAHVCPKCPDGGCVDDYDYSPEQLKKLEAWEKDNEVQNR